MLICIRGAGDIATGIALRLIRSGFSVVMTELAHPTAIRRTVCFSEAVALGTVTVEGVHAAAVSLFQLEQLPALLAASTVPVIVDPDGSVLSLLKPDVVVDGRLAKQGLDTGMQDAPLVIGVGPGFTVGENCHAVVETQRGHTLGRVLYCGSALSNTGVPGNIGGYTAERIIRAPKAGIFHDGRAIASLVTAGDIVGYVDDTPVTCQITGVLRGILPDHTPVDAGMKSGDVDPRCEVSHCYTASDKALAIGGGVLEAILHWRWKHGI